MIFIFFELTSTSYSFLSKIIFPVSLINTLEITSSVYFFKIFLPYLLILITLSFSSTIITPSSILSINPFNKSSTRYIFSFSISSFAFSDINSEICSKKFNNDSRLSIICFFCTSSKQTNPITPTTSSSSIIGVLISNVSSQLFLLGHSMHIL